VGLAFALIPIAYGLARKVYKQGVKRGTRSKIQEPEAAMKPDSKKEEQDVHSTAIPNADTATPAGREEVHASKTAADQGTQKTPRKRVPKKKGVETIPDQPLNPKK
jgi:hypothetical protein